VLLQTRKQAASGRNTGNVRIKSGKLWQAKKTAGDRRRTSSVRRENIIFFEEAETGAG
jgi:hypothetical protein